MPYFLFLLKQRLQVVQVKSLKPQVQKYQIFLYQKNNIDDLYKVKLIPVIL
jgi:hypothetical protein